MQLFLQDKLGGALPQLPWSPRVGAQRAQEGEGSPRSSSRRMEPTNPPLGALSSEDRFSPEGVACGLCSGGAAVPLVMSKRRTALELP